MSNKTTIFVISGKNPVKAPGGYAAYSHNLCKILIKLGYDVKIIALDDRENRIENTEIGELHLVYNFIAAKMPFISSVQMAALPFFSYSFSKEIGNIVKKEKINNFLIWGMGPWSFAGVLAKKNCQKAKLISSYFTTFKHEMSGSLKAVKVKDYGMFLKFKYLFVYYLLSPFFNLFEKRIINYSDILVTHYDSTEKILKKEFKVNPKKFRKISYYTEIFKRKGETQTKRNINSNKSLILTICRQDPRKGINYLLRAIKILSDQGLQFNCQIVGSGAMLKYNKNLSKKLKIHDKVEFLGFVKDFSSLFKNCAMFVFPPIEEGSGSLSILEAMSQGASIVTTKCDGIPEDLEDNKSALLVNKEDPIQLSEAILRLMNDKKLSKKIGKEAKKQYNAKFGFNKMSHDIKNLLNLLVN